MDTLNTFEDKIKGHFTSKTSITREHKDRFVQSSSSNLLRKIDPISEFQGLTKYKIGSQDIPGYKDAVLSPSVPMKWYLVYANSNGHNIGDSNVNEAVNCFLLPKSPLSVNAGTGEPVSAMMQSIFGTHTYDFTMIVHGNISIGNNTWTVTETDPNFLVIYKLDQNTYTLVSCSKSAQGAAATLAYISPTAYITFNTTSYTSANYDTNAFDGADLHAKWLAAYNNTTVNKYANSYAKGGIVSLLTIDDLNKTLSTLIKIIALPYCPIPFNTNTIGVIETPDECDVVQSISLGNTAEAMLNKFALQFKRADQNFLAYINSLNISEFEIELPAVADRLITPKQPLYESKLYHSDFYNYMFNYDSFNKLIPLENIQATTTTPSVVIDYKQSNNALSALGFKFTIDEWTRKVDNYDEYLICNRNNEAAIYNSSYLNYIRNGYNYDVKNKQVAETKAITTAAVGVGASLAAGLAGAMINPALGIAAGLVSAATTAITSGINIHYQNVAAENAIEQKIQEAQATSNSISVSDDINLLEWYNGNFLKLNKFVISDKQWKNVFEMFYNTGYACTESKIPNLDSRKMFNFLQANIDLDTKNDADLIKYYTDIKTRFQSGVTDIHSYDLYNKTLENWES